jgi:acetoin utilization protein AcuB
MYVGMWMTKDVVTIEPTATLDAAARLMADHRIRRLPVLEGPSRDSKLVGILSATDVLHALPPNLNPFAGVPTRDRPTFAPSTDASISVQDVMTRDPFTIAADAPIEAAAALLRSRKIGALPVVRSARLLGMITESDVFRAFTQLFDLSAAGARISFDISQDEDVLPFIAETAKKHDLRVTSFVSLRTIERPMCVVHVAGRAIDAMLDDVWRSRHRVTSVLRGANAANLGAE